MLLRALILFLFIGAEAHSTEPKLTLDVGAINNPSQQQVNPGDRGNAVVRAQILLDRAHFSCGAIDGQFGSNLQKTVTAFQNDRHLPASGVVDPATWAALNGDQAPAIISYTITDDDEKGPFIQIPKDLMEQAKLPAMGYTSPRQELAERFHTTGALLEALNPSADLTKAGRQLNVPNAITMPPGQASEVDVSQSESSVRAIGPDGKLLAFYVATIGSDHDPLPIGNWKIQWVKQNPVFHYDARLFWDAHHKDEKADIQPGPNNPVGVVWMDLSKEHYGIHGTPDASLVGHATSHGCIRLTNWDAEELSQMVKPGTPAILKE